MREADRITIDEFGLPGFTLMEVAGRGATDALLDAYGPATGLRALILCGKGNNGGDGLVVARHLVERGATVHVVCAAEDDEMRDDPAHNLRLLRALKAQYESLHTESEEPRLEITAFNGLQSLRQAIRIMRPTLCVDALLGTGLTSEPREPIRSMVQALNEQSANEQPAPVVALDVPTGLHSNTGRALKTCVHADRTLTMAALKTGLALNDGPTLAGPVDVVDIGMPRHVLRRVAQSSGCALRTTDDDLRRWWPQRAHDAHKYSVGMTIVVGGAPGYTGAPVMASQAAARAGSGYVACACPASIQPALAQKPQMTAIPTLALPGTDNGLAPGIVDTLGEQLEKARALLVGPGLGRADATAEAVRELLADTTLPVVVDADGLNALAGSIQDMSPGGQWILTPHAGEFRRLAGRDIDLDDRVGVAQSYAERWDAVLLLKGHPSVVAAPNGRTFVGGTGGPMLATAGTGDVLAGLCAGFLAQGLEPLHAAAAALHLGGAAAERFAAHADPRTLQAPDLIDAIPAAARNRIA